MKHTKGKWGITKRDEGDYIIMCPPEIGIHLALVHNCSDNCVEANAKLIAAAPELLEALINAMPYLHQWASRSPTLKNAEQAIQKATQ